MKKLLTGILLLSFVATSVFAQIKVSKEAKAAFDKTIQIDPKTKKPYDLGGLEVMIGDWWSDKNNVPKTIIEGNERKATKEKKDNNSTVSIENELIKQLRIKDEQIAALQEQNRLLIENNSILTAALNTSQQSLQTEQALHAGTIKMQLTDTSGSENEPEKKQSIFKKIFGKKKLK